MKRKWLDRIMAAAAGLIILLTLVLHEKKQASGPLNESNACFIKDKGWVPLNQCGK